MKPAFSTTLAALASLIVISTHAATTNWALSNLPKEYYYHDFYDGVAICRDSANHKSGAINSDGKIFIPLMYDYLSDFNGDYAIAHTEQGEGIIDYNNQFVLNPQQGQKIAVIYNPENLSQQLKNCFLVTDTRNQTQAIFYKDKLVCDYEPAHSIAIDIFYPLLRLSSGEILNTTTGEMANTFYDMGWYFLTLNEQTGQIEAMEKTTGKDITLYTIGDEATKHEALRSATENASNVTVGGSFDVTAMITNTMDNAIQTTYCQIFHENGEWLLRKRDGTVIQRLKDSDGWNCFQPYFQMSLVWFERNIPNSDKREIKLFTIAGDELVSYQSEGDFRVKLFPKLWHILGQTFVSYASPNIAITESTKDGIDKETQFFSALAPKKKYICTGEGSGAFTLYENYIIYKRADNQYTIHGLETGKDFSALQIINYGDHIIFGKDPKGIFFTLSTFKGTYTTLSKFTDIKPFRETVAVADNNGKVVIDASGKVLVQEDKNLQLVGNGFSEGVLLAFNKISSQYGYIYNPLTADTLTYNTGFKTDMLYQKGKEYCDAKKYNKAKQCFQSIFKHDHTATEAITQYADCFYAQRNYPSAISYYKLALKTQPDSPDIQSKLQNAQDAKERQDNIKAAIYAVASSLNSTLENVAGALNVNVDASNTTTGNDFSSQNKNTSSTTGHNTNNSMYKNADSGTYSNYESQLIKMNTYWETQYNDSDRRYIQSKMRAIRTKWENKGYQMFHSPWEDWNGAKK